MRYAFLTILWGGYVLMPPQPSHSVAVGTDVGVVAEYRPATGRFFFRRASERDPIPVRIGSVVQAGDKITLPAGASVTIQLTTGKTVVFLPGTSVVPEAPPLGERLASIFHTVSRLFDSDYPQSRTAASRGSTSCGPGERPAPIDVPIVASGAKIVAGTHDLPIVWNGGCGPFIVALVKGADTISIKRDVTTRRTRLDSVRLLVARYALRVTDSTGNGFEANLEGASSAPSAPEEIRRDTSALGVIAQAVWLLEADGGRWRFDAFEMLRPLVRQRNPLAGVIADGILWGRD